MHKLSFMNYLTDCKDIKRILKCECSSGGPKLTKAFKKSEPE